MIGILPFDHPGAWDTIGDCPAAGDGGDLIANRVANKGRYSDLFHILWKLIIGKTPQHSNNRAWTAGLPFKSVPPICHPWIVGDRRRKTFQPQ